MAQIHSSWFLQIYTPWGSTELTFSMQSFYTSQACKKKPMTRWFQKSFIFTPYVRKWSNLTSIFFRWVVQKNHHLDENFTPGEPLKKSIDYRRCGFFCVCWGSLVFQREKKVILDFFYQKHQGWMISLEVPWKDTSMGVLLWIDAVSIGI